MQHVFLVGAKSLGAYGGDLYQQINGVPSV